MSTCKFCHREGLEYHENLGKLVDPITGRHHGPECLEPSGYCESCHRAFPKFHEAWMHMMLNLGHAVHSVKL